MGQTAVISDKIVRLGTRSYRQRIESLSGMGVSRSKLARLNSDLDLLYELLYSQFSSITNEDYKIFGDGLEMLINTVKDLSSTLKKSQIDANAASEISALERNYSALEELKEDIRTFRTGVGVDSELTSLFSTASKLMNSSL